MNNPPAFPLHNHGAQTLGLHVTGMSLRDYFAAKAMPYLMSAYEDIDAIAGVAYKVADAMLKAREE
jgi:hypothetical protein